MHSSGTTRQRTSGSSPACGPQLSRETALQIVELAPKGDLRRGASTPSRRRDNFLPATRACLVVLAQWDEWFNRVQVRLNTDFCRMVEHLARHRDIAPI